MSQTESSRVYMQIKWKLVLFELLIVLIIVLVLLLAFHLFISKRPDFFYRDKPEGLCQAALPDKPNWVSSLVYPSDGHYIRRLPEHSLEKIVRAIHRLDPKTYVVLHPTYIEGYRRSHYFRFTDWFCIKEDGNITSTAAVGYSDLGKNRQWVEALRKQL